MVTTLIVHDASPLVSKAVFRTTIWTLCGVATLFLASRLAVRMSTKGRLMVNDYFLVAAFPMLFLSYGLLHSVLNALYPYGGVASETDLDVQPSASNAGHRLTAAIELLWIVIYCVKFCFLAQFKFRKPLYACVSVHLTRYYWATISICGIAFLFTVIQPIILCPSSGACRYFDQSETLSWETALTAIDIATDLLVISIPALLIHMANFALSHAIINCVFKGLSIFSAAIAVTRLATQFHTESHRIQYATLVFLLAVEAAVALIMAGISSYRVMVLDYLAERRVNKAGTPTQPAHPQMRSARGSFGRNDPDPHYSSSFAELPILGPTQLTASSPNT